MYCGELFGDTTKGYLNLKQDRKFQLLNLLV